MCCPTKVLAGEQLDELFLNTFSLLEYLARLAAPLTFKTPAAQANSKAVVIYGECGSGKSTHLNNLMMTHAARLKYKEKPEAFKAAQSTASVTKSVSDLTIGTGPEAITFFDVPGTNDPDGQGGGLSDEAISEGLVNALERFEDGDCAGVFSDNRKGINVIIHCIMFDSGARVK